LLSLVRHDDRAGGGQHAAHTVADRDFWRGICAVTMPRSRRKLSCKAYMAECIQVGEAAAIGAERQPGARAGVALGNEGAGLTRAGLGPDLKTVDREMCRSPGSTATAGEWGDHPWVQDILDGDLRLEGRCLDQLWLYALHTLPDF
jgi:hypothetical protein